MPRPSPSEPRTTGAARDTGAQIGGGASLCGDHHPLDSLNRLGHRDRVNAGRIGQHRRFSLPGAPDVRVGRSEQYCHRDSECRRDVGWPAVVSDEQGGSESNDLISSSDAPWMDVYRLNSPKLSPWPAMKM